MSSTTSGETAFSCPLVFYNPMIHHQLVYQRNPNLQDDDYCFKNELVGSELIKWNEEDGGNSNINNSVDEDSNWPSKMQKSRKRTHGHDDWKWQEEDQKIISFSSSNANEAAHAHAQDHDLSVQHEKTQIRVCSDCCTTKTPLWRSGPNGPKSLCNACGIRQRKARRAMAIAAESHVKMKIYHKHKTDIPILSNKHSKLKKHCHKSSAASAAAELSSTCKRHDQSRWPKADSVEDFFRNSSKNLAFQRVMFPQDEKDAAILLMALSSGLVHA